MVSSACRKLQGSGHSRLANAASSGVLPKPLVGLQPGICACRHIDSISSIPSPLLAPPMVHHRTLSFPVFWYKPGQPVLPGQPALGDEVAEYMPREWAAPHQKKTHKQGWQPSWRQNARCDIPFVATVTCREPPASFMTHCLAESSRAMSAGCPPRGGWKGIRPVTNLGPGHLTIVCTRLQDAVIRPFGAGAISLSRLILGCVVNRIFPP